jgi:hypothetical protein
LVRRGDNQVSPLGLHGVGSAYDLTSGKETDYRYEFTFELPQTLATHDWHPEGKIRHELYAEIEGIPASHFSFFHRTQSPSHRNKSKSRHQSPSASTTVSRHVSPHNSHPGSRTASPARGEHSFLDSMREPPTISLVQQINTLPPVPTYEQSEYDHGHGSGSGHARASGHGSGSNGHGQGNGQGEDGSWLEGTFKVTRAVKLVYNPHPTGGINALEERTAGEVPGLGGYELMFRAPVVSPLPFRLRFQQRQGVFSPFPPYCRKGWPALSHLALGSLTLAVDRRIPPHVFLPSHLLTTHHDHIRYPNQPNPKYPHNIPTRFYRIPHPPHIPNHQIGKKTKSRFTSSRKRIQITLSRRTSSWE